MILERFVRNVFGCGIRESAVSENIEREHEQRQVTQRQLDAQVRLLYRQAEKTEAAAQLLERLQKDMGQ